MTETDGNRLTVDDEIVARARIHAREVCGEVGEYDLDMDFDALEWDVSARARRRAGLCRWDRTREVATIILARRAYERYDWPEFAASCVTNSSMPGSTNALASRVTDRDFASRRRELRLRGTAGRFPTPGIVSLVSPRTATGRQSAIAPPSR